jgi:hypothetical protein
MKIDIAKWELLCKQMSIDLEKYRNKDIASAINNLVNTPFKVVLQFMLWPLIFILAICLSGIFLIWPQSWAGGTLWILTGLLVGPLSGITVAAYWVVSGLDESSKKLYKAALDSMKDISTDLRNNAEKIPDNLELPSYKEMLRLVKLSLVFPALKELMIKKLWPIGSWIGNIVVNYLKKMSQKSEELLENEQENQITAGIIQIRSFADKIIKNTELLKNNIDKAHKKASKLILSPLRFTMRMSLFLNALSLLLIWYFFL